MPETPGAPDHTRCRHLVWEASPEDGHLEPGTLCENRLGVFHLLDCPVYLGRRCCLFSPRAEGEEPAAPDPDRIRDLKLALSEDYLRWPYRRRVTRLHAAEPPPGEDPVPEPPPAPAREDRRPPRSRQEHPPKR